MLSRVIVKIAGMVVPELTGTGTVADLNDFIVSQHDRMKRFLDSVSQPRETSEFNPAAVNLSRSLADLVRVHTALFPCNLLLSHGISRWHISKRCSRPAN